ncbi:N-6 DNA methylase [Sporosarcina sp. SAFN-015]|uniref:N-6 DNA methylase n=1 Tax=Sporosarcina sp. SAFN-015 TaxID=3387274 RepID=UPI003F7F756C
MTEERIYLEISEWNALLGIDDSYKAPDALWAILRDRERREELFRKALELHRYNVDYDWFHRYFQDEHADRAQKKQDFTPNSVATLLSELVSGGRKVGDTYYEPCAGTGGIIIRQWHADRIRHTPFDYLPSMYLYQAEELSDRALPFLLFNLAIRGMNASVVQVDVLSRKGAKGAWLVQNTNDDHLQFSTIHLFPYDDATADYFSVEWTAFDAGRYEPFDPVGDFPAHLGGNEFLDAVRHEVAETIVTCDKCAAVLPDGVAFDYSPEYGDVCEGCAEEVAE